jgi:Tetratricopeptide repeat
MKPCSNRRAGEWIALHEMGALGDDQQAIFLDHLVECEYCYNQVYSLEPVMATFRRHRLATRHVGQPAALRARRLPALWPARWASFLPLTAAFAILLIVAVGVFYRFSQRRAPEAPKLARSDAPALTGEAGRRLRDGLEIPKASYLPPKEPIALRQPAARAFNTAMAAYQKNDYHAAIEQLETLDELQPDNPAEVKFYLGVSLLLAGRSPEAIRPLQAAAELSSGPSLESSRYYLALAYLKSDHLPQALAALDSVVAMNGERQFAAERLKVQIAEASREAEDH